MFSLNLVVTTIITTTTITSVGAG
ncbi:ThrAB operon attenuation leader peptide ThrL [Shewanella loihica]